jgi:hypothetical protein
MLQSGMLFPKRSRTHVCNATKSARRSSPSKFCGPGLAADDAGSYTSLGLYNVIVNYFLLVHPTIVACAFLDCPKDQQCRGCKETRAAEVGYHTFRDGQVWPEATNMSGPPGGDINAAIAAIAVAAVLAAIPIWGRSGGSALHYERTGNQGDASYAAMKGGFHHTSTGGDVDFALPKLYQPSSNGNKNPALNQNWAGAALYIENLHCDPSKSTLSFMQDLGEEGESGGTITDTSAAAGSISCTNTYNHLTNLLVQRHSLAAPMPRASRSPARSRLKMAAFPEAPSKPGSPSCAKTDEFTAAVKIQTGENNYKFNNRSGDRSVARKEAVLGAINRDPQRGRQPHEDVPYALTIKFSENVRNLQL